jgi:2,5-diketo-D-gluconate reductase B
MKNKNGILAGMREDEMNGMPDLGLGTWALRGKHCEEVVEVAIKMGYRHIDTAELYENEREIGGALRNSNILRSELFIASKVSPENFDTIEESFNKSVQKLGLNYLDLYILHWPAIGMDIKKIFIGLVKLQSERKIRNIGVSNFNMDILKVALSVSRELGLKIHSNQIEFNPFVYPRELVEFCQKNNIKVVAYSPLAKGEVVKNSVLVKLGRKYGKTAAQISLRWLIQKGAAVIPKAGNIEHLRENMDIDFEILEEDIKLIDDLTI